MRRTSHKHTLNLTYFIYYAIIQGMSEHFTPQPGEDLTGEQDPMVSGPKPEQHEQEQSPTRLINYLCGTSDSNIVAVVRNPNIKEPSSYREEHDVYIGTVTNGLYKAEITEFRHLRDGGTSHITVQRALPDDTKEEIRLYFPRPEYPFRREGPYIPVQGKQPTYNGESMEVFNNKGLTAIADEETGTLQLQPNEKPATENTEPEQSTTAQPASPEAAAADLDRQSSRQRGRGCLSQGILWLLGLYSRR